MKRYIRSDIFDVSEDVIQWRKEAVSALGQLFINNFVKDVNSKYGSTLLTGIDKSTANIDYYNDGSPFYHWIRYPVKDKYLLKYNVPNEVVTVNDISDESEFLVEIDYYGKDGIIVKEIVTFNTDVTKDINEQVSLTYNAAVNAFVKNFNKAFSRSQKEANELLGNGASINRVVLPTTSQIKEDFLYLIQDSFEDMGGDISQLKLSVSSKYKKSEMHGYVAYVYNVKCTYNGKTTMCNEVYLDTQDEYVPAEDIFDQEDEVYFMVKDILE